MAPSHRRASRSRKTSETDVALSVDLDGSGRSGISTGIAFFDHMLDLFSRHALVDLEVRVAGDLSVDYHHTVEDTGIVLGECLREALGGKEGLNRYGHAYVPMDEALSRVVIDLSDRPWLEFHAPGDTPSAQNLPFSLVEEFCRAMASNLRANLHVEVLRGRDGHHITESVFKGLARAFRMAASLDPRVRGVPSTKDVL